MNPRRKYPKPGAEPFSASPKDMKEAWKPVAIPTTYNGVNFKSRLEAQTAFLFDTFGILWEYEPKSLMLSNGTCYTPDFWLPDQRSVLECRGYKTDKGERQILGFASAIRNGIRANSKTILDYFVVKAYLNRIDDYRHIDEDDDDPISGTLLLHCCACPGWTIGSFEIDGCGNCGAPPCCCDAAMALTIYGGALALNGFRSDHWTQLRDSISKEFVK